MHLRELLGPARMRWLLVSNYMIDMPWLITAVPALLDADRVVIAHGEAKHPTR